MQHSPLQPRSGEPLLIEARIRDQKIRSVAVQYQLVYPGKYVRKEDDAFQKDWAELPMVDDGANGDRTA